MSIHNAIYILLIMSGLTHATGLIPTMYKIPAGCEVRCPNGICTTVQALARQLTENGAPPRIPTVTESQFLHSGPKQDYDECAVIGYSHPVCIGFDLIQKSPDKNQLAISSLHMDANTSLIFLQDIRARGQQDEFHELFCPTDCQVPRLGKYISRRLARACAVFLEKTYPVRYDQHYSSKDTEGEAIY